MPQNLTPYTPTPLYPQCAHNVNTTPQIHLTPLNALAHLAAGSGRTQKQMRR